MDFLRRHHWPAALLEQPDVRRRAGRVRLPPDSRAGSNWNGVLARRRDRCWPAAGAITAVRQHDYLLAAQSGIHARKPDALAGCEISRLDVWSEMDSAWRSDRFYNWLSPATAVGLIQFGRDRFSISAQRGYFQQSQAAQHLGDVCECLCGVRAVASREAEIRRHSTGDRSGDLDCV